MDLAATPELRLPPFPRKHNTFLWISGAAESAHFFYYKRFCFWIRERLAFHLFSKVSPAVIPPSIHPPTNLPGLLQDWLYSSRWNWYLLILDNWDNLFWWMIVLGFYPSIHLSHVFGQNFLCDSVSSDSLFPFLSQIAPVFQAASLNLPSVVLSIQFVKSGDLYLKTVLRTVKRCGPCQVELHQISSTSLAAAAAIL